MALKRNERYPGRFQNPTSAHPQGAFKNRTSPTSQDGSYLESDWANDWSGFFESLLSAAGITPNGNVDAVGASQYFNALQQRFTSHSQTFTSSGSFTVPAGVTTLYVSGCGGGGGGGSGATNNGGQSSLVGGGGGGGGGGGKFTLKQVLTVTPGQTLPITIGAAGLGGAASNAGAGNAGTNGGETYIAGVISLPGGNGGGGGSAVIQNVAGYGGAGGAGGAGFPNGQYGSDGNYTGNGGNGGSTTFGGGGGGSRAATNTTQAGGSAAGFGGGGGGSGGGYGQATINVPTGAGGNGAPGLLIVEW